MGRIAAGIGKVGRHYRQTRGSIVSTKELAQVAELRTLQAQLRAEQPDNIAWRGSKVYSQNDEDGLIAHIFSILPGGTFLEIGVEDGTECNTHLLLLKGWRGAWVEASATMGAHIADALGGDHFPGHFRLRRQYATTDNIAALYRETCGELGVGDVDFFSLDIDSIDLHLLAALLGSGAKPSVVCVEYNGLFPPPIALSADHQGADGWAHDDYFGATLQSFADLLLPAGYVLLTCNLVGANAFFARADLWGDRPSFAPAEVWQPLRLYLGPLPRSHVPTLKFLRDVLAGGSPRPAAS